MHTIKLWGRGGGAGWDVERCRCLCLYGCGSASETSAQPHSIYYSYTGLVWSGLVVIAFTVTGGCPHITLLALPTMVARKKKTPAQPTRLFFFSAVLFYFFCTFFYLFFIEGRPGVSKHPFLPSIFQFLSLQFPPSLHSATFCVFRRVSPRCEAPPYRPLYRRVDAGPNPPRSPIFHIACLVQYLMNITKLFIIRQM